MTPRSLFAASALLAAACLAGCTSSGAPPAPPASSAPAGVTPGGFVLPSGSGCAGEVARFQAVMDNDLATGHTTAGVHGRVSAELSQARATCQAGSEAAAIAQVNATKARFGYR